MFKKRLLSVILGGLSALMLGGGLLCAGNTSAREEITAVATGSQIAQNRLDYETPEYYGDTYVEITDPENLSAQEFDKYYTSLGYSFPHYTISSAQDLVTFSALVNGGILGKDDIVVLEKNISLSSEYWTPIGTNQNPFKGVFLGNGHTISNITILDNTLDSSLELVRTLGLFGCVQGGTIADLTIRGGFFANIKATADEIDAGILVGAVIDDSTQITNIINCHDETTSAYYKYEDNLVEISGLVGTNMSTTIDMYEKTATEVSNYVFSDGSQSLKPRTLYYTNGRVTVSPRKYFFYNIDKTYSSLSWFETNLCLKHNGNYSYKLYEGTGADCLKDGRKSGHYYTAFLPEYLGLVVARMPSASSSSKYDSISWNIKNYEFTYHYEDYDVRGGTRTIEVPSAYSLSERYFKASNLSDYEKQNPELWGRVFVELYGAYGNYVKVININGKSTEHEFAYADNVEELSVRLNNIMTNTSYKDITNYDYTHIAYGTLTNEGNWKSPCIKLNIKNTTLDQLKKADYQSDGKKGYSVEGKLIQDEKEIGTVIWKVLPSHNDNILTDCLAIQNNEICFYPALSKKALKEYSYSITCQVISADFKLGGYAFGYGGALPSTATEPGKWNDKMWGSSSLKENDLIENNIIFSTTFTSNLSEGTAWDSYYITNGKSTRPKYDDSGEYTSIDLSVVEKKANIKIQYFDEYNLSSPLDTSSTYFKLGGTRNVYALINGVEFKNSDENASVPMHETGESSGDKITAYSNMYYYPKKFVVSLKKDLTNGAFSEEQLKNQGIAFSGSGAQYSYSADFITNKHDNGDGGNVTYIAIILARQTYNLNYDVSAKNLSNSVTASIKGEKKILSESVSYSLSVNGKNVSVSPDNGKLPWGTQLSATFTFTDIGQKLFNVSSSVTAFHTFSDPQDATFTHSVSYRPLRVIFDKYKQGASEQSIAYTKDILVTFEGVLPLSASKVDGSKLFTSAGALNYSNIGLSVVKNQTFGGYSDFDFSKGVLLPENLYTKGEGYIVGTSQTLSGVLTQSTLSSSSAVKEALLQQSSFSEGNGYGALVHVGVIVYEREINYTINFANKDGASILNASTPLSGVTHTLSGTYTSALILPKYSWTGHKITNFTYKGENLLTSNYDSSLTQTISLSDSQKQSAFSLTGKVTRISDINYAYSTYGEQSAKVDIAVKWERKIYTISVDAGTLDVQINDKISLKLNSSLSGESDNFKKQNIANTGDRNGQAVFNVYRLPLTLGGNYPSSASTSVTGGKSNGFNITGFAFSVNSSSTKTFSYTQSLVIDEETIKAIESEIARGGSSKISSQRENATYKVYLQTNSAYTITKNNNGTGSFGGVFKILVACGNDGGGVFVYANATSSLAIFSNVTLNGAITLSRNGYALSGWKSVANASGVKAVDDSGKLVVLTDSGLIAPVFDKQVVDKGNMSVLLNFASGVPTHTTTTTEGGMPSGTTYAKVYSLGSYDIVTISLSGTWITTNPTSQVTLANGDRIVYQTISVYKFSGSDYSLAWTGNKQTSFKPLFNYNISSCQGSGFYKVEVEYTIQDTLSSNTSTLSSHLFYKVERNKLISSGLQTTYSPDGKIFAGISGNVGTCLNFAGSGDANLNKTFQNIFSSTIKDGDVKLVSGDIVAGSTKRGLLIKASVINKSVFGITDSKTSITDIFEYVQSSGVTYIKLFSAGESSIPDFSGLVINKAELEINFGNISVFERTATQGGLLIKEDVTLAVGKVIYHYDALTLTNYASGTDTYVAGGNGVFALHGLEICYPNTQINSANSVKDNYNTTISGSVKIVSIQNTFKKEIRIQGVTLENNILCNNGENPTLKLVDAYSFAQVTLSGIDMSSGRYEKADSEGVIYFVLQNEQGFDVYINTAHSKALRGDLVVNLTFKSSNYGLLKQISTSITNPTIPTLTGLGISNFGDNVSGRAEVNRNTSSNLINFVISDIVKLKIKNITNDNLSKYAYLKVGGGALNIASIDSGYTHAQLKYIGFDKSSDEYLTISTSEVGGANQTSLSALKLRKEQTLTPKYELVGYSASYPAQGKTLNFTALPNDKISIAKTSIFGELNSTELPWGEGDVVVGSFTINKRESQANQKVTLSGDKFLVYTQLSNGDIFSPTSLSGEYFASIEYKYKSKTIQKVFNFKLNVALNSVTINLSESQRVYSGREVRGESLRVNYSFNSITQNSSLSDIATSLKISNSVFYGGNSVQTMKDSGAYTIKLSPRVGYENIWDFTEKSLTYTITPYEIQGENWQLTKYMSKPDKLSISHTVVATGESVTLTFTRKAGESLGYYPFTGVSVDEINRKNYTVAGNLGGLTIEEPIGLYHLDSKGQVLSIVYDGKAPSNDQLSIACRTSENGKNVYSLTINHNGQTKTIDVDLYYTTKENERVEVPSDSPFTLSFESISKNAGVYNIILYVGDRDCENNGVNLTITPKEISVTKVEKTFDGNKSFNNATITLDGVVTGENLTLSGEFESEKAGSRKLKNLSLSDSQNYTLKNSQVYGTILKANISSFKQNVSQKANIYYGDIQTSSVTSQLANYLSIDFTVNGISGVVKSGYVQVASISLSQNIASTSGNVPSGERGIIIALSSEDFANINSQTFTITIQKKNIDLSSIIIEKLYDGNYLASDKRPLNTLPSSLPSLEGKIIEGDKVEISSASRFSIAENFLTGNCSFENFALDGADKDNYQVTALPQGKINGYRVSVSLQEKAITFVNDGENVNKRGDNYEFLFPFEREISSIYSDISSLIPTRVGYTANWHYENNALVENNSTFEEQLVAMSQTSSHTGLLIAHWTIKTFTLKVDYPQSLASVTPASPSQIEYYSNLQILVEAKQGYKLANIIQSEGGYNKEESTPLTTGKRRTEGSYVKVNGNISLTLEFSQISVVFNISTQIPSVNGKTFTRTDSNPTRLSYSLNSLSQYDGEELGVFTLTKGTFKHVDFEYKAKDTSVKRVGNKTLLDVVNDSADDIQDDIVIEISLVWEGEDYEIIFDLNSKGNSTTPGTISNKTMKFGEAFPLLPIATMSGKQVSGWNINGTAISQGQLLDIIGTQQGNKFFLTAIAEWEGSEFTLTIRKGEHIANILTEGNNVEDGNEFIVKFEGAERIFVVTASEGYYPIFNDDQFKGFVQEIAGQKGYFKVKDLTENSTLTFIGQPSINSLTLGGEHIQSVIVCDGEGVEISPNAGNYPLETGKVGVITFIAEKGYIFDRTTLPSLSGYGRIEVQECEEENKIIVKWLDFVGDGVIEITPLARQNRVTIKANNLFESVSYDGGITYYPLTSDVSLQIQTQTSKDLIFRLKYGYKNAGMENDERFTLTNSRSVWNDENKIYIQTITMSDVKEDLEATLVCEARQYDFALSISTGMGSFAQITTSESQKITYGQKLDLAMQVTDPSFGFVGWQMFGETFCMQENAQIMLDEGMKANLERGVHGEGAIIQVIALVKEMTRDILISTNEEGGVTFSYIDVDDNMQEKTCTLTKNASEVKKLKIGDVISFQFILDDGYSFNQLKINQEQIDVLSNSYGITLSGNILKIKISKDFDEIAFLFKANEFLMTAKAVVEIYHTQSQPTNEGGGIYICDEQGGMLDEYEEGSQIGYFFTTQTFTNDIIYILVQPKAGYIPTLTATNMQVSSVENADKIIYKLSSIKEGASLLCIFTARANKISVKFVLDNSTTSVSAGKFVAITNSNLVYSINNNAPSIQIGALTNASLGVEGYVNINYNLVVESEQIKSKVVYSSGREDSGDFIIGSANATDHALTGFTYSFMFTLSNIQEDATIYIYVSPKIYNLRLYIDEEDQVFIKEGITFGQAISLSTLTEEQNAKVFKQKHNFDLGGYFTMQLGQGSKYITADGITLNVWTETGYVYNGIKYTPTTNYDEASETFTLFAFWQYKKAYITLDFIPTLLKNNFFKTFAISDFVSNGFAEAKGWTSDANKYYAEIMCGKNLVMKALSVEGYVFDRWIVSFGGEDQEFVQTTFSYTFENLNYTVKAIYKPTYSLTTYCINSQTANGGSAIMMQEGEELDGVSFSSEAPLRLVAEAIEGYEFQYFEMVDSGRKMVGELIGGKYYYTLEKQSSPLSIRAVFRGRAVNVDIDLTRINRRHVIEGVYINGVRRNLSANKLSANDIYVGDSIKIKIRKSVGYKVEAEHDLFALTITPSAQGRNDEYIYDYQIEYTDLRKQDDKLYLEEVFTANGESINFTIVNGVEENGKFFASSVGGKVEMNMKNTKTKIEGTKQFEFLFGEEFTIELSPIANWKLAYFIVNNDKLAIIDLSQYMNGKVLTINQEFVRTYYDNRAVSLKICFKAMIWSDSDSRSTSLQGKGTKDNPYLVSSASDFGFVAYAINNNLAGANGLLYKDAYFLVTKNINFAGKFWSPIGEKNAFNGTFDLGKYQFSNIMLDKTYNQPETSYRGLFLNLTEKAVIIIDNSKTVLISGIFMGVAAGALVVIFISWRINRNKKDRFDKEVDLAN